MFGASKGQALNKDVVSVELYSNRNERYPKHVSVDIVPYHQRGIQFGPRNDVEDAPKGRVMLEKNAYPIAKDLYTNRFPKIHLFSFQLLHGSVWMFAKAFRLSDMHPWVVAIVFLAPNPRINQLSKKYTQVSTYSESKNISSSRSSEMQKTDAMTFSCEHDKYGSMAPPFFIGSLINRNESC